MLSSRTAEYREATRIAFGLSIKLAGAAGIELRPVQPDDAATYLLGILVADPTRSVAGGP